MRLLFRLALASAVIAAPASAQQYDVILANATIIDGSGAARYTGSVGITGNRIARVARDQIPAAQGKRVIDVKGHVVAPGFIDLHAHIDGITRMPDAESSARQGITLALGGPDGGGPWPFGTYLDSVAKLPLGINVAYLAGHNTIRREVMQTANRAPTPAELERMKRMVQQSMLEGAFGLSTGLRYVPGFYAKTDEVVELSKMAAALGGIYTSHLREEGLGLLEGVAEAIQIGKEAKIPVVLTHHKAIGQKMWGKSVNTLAMVDSARRNGIDVMIDQYPYTASSTSFAVLMPNWAMEGGTAELKKRLDNPELRTAIEKGILDLLLNDRGGGDLKRVQFASVSWDPTLNGKTLYDWAVKRGLPPTPEGAVPLVIEGVLAGSPSMVFHVMDERDVRRIMAHPQTMIASDGALSRPGASVPHPRNYGTFPRVLGMYVRDQKVITLENAINKMTGMPAKRLKLTDRGCIREGCAADITVFDPATVADKGTFTEPHQYPVGIEYVFVAGQAVVAEGKMTTARPGQVLRRK